MRVKLYREVFSGIYALSYVCLNQDFRDYTDEQDKKYG